MPSSRPLGRVALFGMALVSLMMGHELTYVLAHGLGAGYEHAMAEGGHSGYWTSFVLTVVGLSLILVGVATLQLRRLGRLARRTRIDGLAVADAAPRCFIDLLARTWPRVGLLAVGLFLVQENVELWAASQPMPFLDVLAGEHAMALPVLAAVSLLAAVVGALVGWRRHVLRSRIEAIRTWARPTAGRRPTLPSSRPLTRITVSSHGLRAPPVAVAA